MIKQASAQCPNLSSGVSKPTLAMYDAVLRKGFWWSDRTIVQRMLVHDLLLEIDRNEWVSGDPLPWDIEADWQKLTLRESARQISVSLNMKTVPLELKGELWRNGKRVSLDKRGIFVEGTPTKLQIAEMALVGTTLDVDTSKWSVGPGDNPYWMMVSWPNRRERLWKAKDEWRKIKANMAAAARLTTNPLQP
jgi:hypothetical protein